MWACFPPSNSKALSWLLVFVSRHIRVHRQSDLGSFLSLPSLTFSRDPHLLPTSQTPPPSLPAASLQMLKSPRSSKSIHTMLPLGYPSFFPMILIWKIVNCLDWEHQHKPLPQKSWDGAAKIQPPLPLFFSVLLFRGLKQLEKNY